MYDKQVVEECLRNYTILNQVSIEKDDKELLTVKMDIDKGLRKLQGISVNLHNTLLGVFVYGNPIQEQAKQMGVSKRQILRRLDDGLHMLTMIMNGEVL